MRSTNTVRDYFNREAERFDSIYDRGKPPRQRVVDRLFRRVVLERFRLICNLATLSGRWTVLDVGCGAGRYAFALGTEGASRVVGVDVSEEMIRMARDEAEKRGLAAKCEFLLGAWSELPMQETFDVVIATGYFDYIKEPSRDLNKMVTACSGRVFASFPKRWECRVPIRRLRFALARGFVRFYSRQEVLGLFAGAGVAPERLSLIDLGRDWIAVARP
jgi:ubiquinone/menaquinone biosynthesis C-methylase UbiE